jgi:hydrogenase maturation protease
VSDAAETVVIGLGNVVLSDDGLGVHAVRRLRERYEISPGVELIEGGTAGLLLLPYVTDARRAILIDAIDGGARPGTLVRLAGEAWATAFAIRMTPHDVGLADLLGALRLTAAWPEELVLYGAQPAATDVGSELSAAVAAALDPLVDAVAAELAGWGAHMRSVAAGSGAPLESRSCA